MWLSTIILYDILCFSFDFSDENEGKISEGSNMRHSIMLLIIKNIDEMNLKQI